MYLWPVAGKVEVGEKNEYHIRDQRGRLGLCAKFHRNRREKVPRAIFAESKKLQVSSG